ncbi:MAG: hypothetical protein AAGF30_13475 [Pseudomonadota bacterium]
MNFSPDAITSFMTWYRGASERAWARIEEYDLAYFRENGVGGPGFYRGTRWRRGYSLGELAEIERRERASLPIELSTFLSVCGCTDRGMKRFAYKGDQLRQQADEPIFYDWRNASEIKRARQKIYDRILQDVSDGLWIEGWGERPQAMSKRRAIARENIRKGARIYPIHGHRVVIAIPDQRLSPVLSSYGTDTILYSSSLCENLIEDMVDLDMSDAPLIPRRDKAEVYKDLKDLPFWGSLL